MAACVRIRLTLVFSVFLGLLAAGVFSAPAQAYDDADRTVNRTPEGIIHYPSWLYNKPEHYEFSPLVSNQDPQNQHPAAWAGQDWETNKWTGQWTPTNTVRKFFHAKIFERQYMRKGKVPVLVLGPTFYKISDLDQRRTLKLLADTSGILKRYPVVELVDWATKDIVGTYSPKGMFLN